MRVRDAGSLLRIEGEFIKPAVVRPVVVLALVAAAWAQAPAAPAAQGRPAAKRNASAGVDFTKDGRTEVFSSTETDLATGEVSVFEVVREFDNLGLLVHERRSDKVDVHVIRSQKTAFTYGQAHRLSKVVTVRDADGEGPVPASVRVDTLTRSSEHKLISTVSSIDEDGDGHVYTTTVIPGSPPDLRRRHRVAVSYRAARAAPPSAAAPNHASRSPATWPRVLPGGSRQAAELAGCEPAGTATGRPQARIY